MGEFRQLPGSRRQRARPHRSEIAASPAPTRRRSGRSPASASDVRRVRRFAQSPPECLGSARRRSRNRREQAELAREGPTVGCTPKLCERLDKNRQISAYSANAAQGWVLVPLEQALCIAAEGLSKRGLKTFHGFLIAKELQDASDARLLTAYGTPYRALGRLERMGLVTSVWEDAQAAADEGRPRRRLYSLTDAGRKAAVEARSASRSTRRARLLADA